MPESVSWVGGAILLSYNKEANNIKSLIQLRGQLYQADTIEELEEVVKKIKGGGARWRGYMITKNFRSFRHPTPNEAKTLESLPDYPIGKDNRQSQEDERTSKFHAMSETLLHTFVFFFIKFDFLYKCIQVYA